MLEHINGILVTLISSVVNLSNVPVDYCIRINKSKTQTIADGGKIILTKQGNYLVCHKQENYCESMIWLFMDSTSTLIQ